MRFFHSLLLTLALTTAACTATPSVRSWVDDRTAVAVTAQNKPLVFAREDFPAGVNVRDYAEVGAFEVNRSGQRQLYLSLIIWSTLNRSAEQQAQTDAAFAGMTIWADDQLIQLKRAAQRDVPSMSNAVFNLPITNAHESYYAITAAQLRALAAAQKLSLSPATQAAGEQSYRLWTDARASLGAFVQSLP